MSNQMFESKITVKQCKYGRLVVCSTSAKSVVEYCPSTGSVNVRRRQ